VAIGSQIDLRLSVGSGSLLAVSPHCFESVQQSEERDFAASKPTGCFLQFVAT
jgi:hypothetical protein